MTVSENLLNAAVAEMEEKKSEYISLYNLALVAMVKTVSLSKDYLKSKTSYFDPTLKLLDSCAL